jgi:DNA-binding transcriptional LysR family regulator
MFMDPLIDLALLQTLVAIDRDGSLVKAAQRVGRTQSAVSLQIQRLEETLNVALFDRSGRSLTLTDAGATMLSFAERMLDLNSDAVAAVRGHQVAGHIRLGISVDFEHTWLPKAMARFAKTHPRIQVDILVARNTALENAVANREIDIALIFASQTSIKSTKASKSTLIGSVPMAWIGTADFVRQPDVNLPLLLLDGVCVFRTAALEALEKSNIPWRSAVTSPSLGGLWATALAGMGVIVRSSILMPPGLIDVGAKLDLPALPNIALRILESEARATPSRITLRALLTELASDAVELP